jgi:hypothetical protein
VGKNIGNVIFWIGILSLSNSPLLAAEEEDYIFLRAGAGKQGMWSQTRNRQEWEGEDDIAAVIHAGYKSPITKNIWWDVTYTHNSQWFRGIPFDSGENEDVLDSISIGIEYRWY